MSFIDLHVHSTFSDGSLNPYEIVELAKTNNLSAIALTDHDTISGLDDFNKAGNKFNLETINGIEISVNHMNFELHILGYFLDLKSDFLNSELVGLKVERSERNLRIIEKLNQIGLKSDVDEIKEIFGRGLITRAHIAEYLLKKKYITAYEEAFVKYIGYGKPAYVPKVNFDKKNTMDLILKSGGVPVLAHPYIYPLEENQFSPLILELKSYGLKGIEAIYPSQSKDKEVFFKQIAKKYGLVITGGSDFHGDKRPKNKLGFINKGERVYYSVLEELRQL